MLLQSHAGELSLLPALPKAWADGSVKGLRARGGYAVDIAWAGGRLREAAIAATVDGPVRLRIRDVSGSLSIAGPRGALGLPHANDGVITFDARAGERYTVRVTN
jgi:alpha-L-fucosidase 2